MKRRGFLGRLFAATFSGAVITACRNRPGEREVPALQSEQDSHEASFKEELANNRAMPRELVMQLLDQKVDQYMEISYHCAQSSFLALSEQFGLGGDEIVKALTPLSGIAERGETCGAVAGSLMIFGLIYGRDRNRLNDWETYRASLEPSGAFCDQFVSAYGSTMCSLIQEAEFGRCFRLTDPEELAEFQGSGATEHCSAVVREAVRIAAGIILDDATL